MKDHAAAVAENPCQALYNLRLAAIFSQLWATCKRVKNVAQLSLFGLSVALAVMPGNPHGWIFATRLGIEKADQDPSKISVDDKVSVCVNLMADLSFISFMSSVSSIGLSLR